MRVRLRPGLLPLVLAIACGATEAPRPNASPAPTPAAPAPPSPRAEDTTPRTPGADVGSPEGGPPSCAPFTTPAAKPGAPAADVTVTLDGARGPHGAPAPVQVDRKLYGLNVADWMPQDYTPTVDPTFLGYLAALEPGVLRWPAGHRSQEYTWATGGPGQRGDWTLTPALVDAFVALAKSVGAEPLLAINMKRGTPAAAADLVRYVNVEKKYFVKYFQMGNEPDLTDGVTSGPEAYATDVLAFASAMRAVDPTIRLVGPELLTGAHVGGINGTTDWMTPILTRAGSGFTGLSWHYYPLDSGQSNPSSSAIVSIPHMFQETANDWPPAGLGFSDTVMPALHALRDAHAPGAKVWVTEIAEDPGPLAGVGISETLAAALWTVDVYGRYAEHGPGAVLRWIYKTVDAHAYGILDGQNRPRGTYGAIWLHARHFGDRYVRTTSSERTQVAAHAARRGDGALTVMLVNKTTTPKRVRLGAQGICAATERRTLTLAGEGLGGTSFTIDGQALTPERAGGGAALVPSPLPLAAGGDLWDVDVPAASARLVVYR